MKPNERTAEMAEPTAEEIAAKAAAEAAAKTEADRIAAEEEEAQKATEGGDDFDKDRAMATIRKLREAEAQGKKDAKALADAQARLRELEQAKMSEDERREVRLKELEAETADKESKLRDQYLRLGVYDLQQELGIADAELAQAALDHSKIEWEDGKPTNLKSLLDDLLERKPLLKGEPPKKTSEGGTGGTDGGSGGGQSKPPALTAEQLEWCKITNTSPEDYARQLQVQTVDDYLASQKKT
jgi:colicin import membrane protein